jgi:hypothetical protein
MARMPLAYQPGRSGSSTHRPSCRRRGPAGNARAKPRRPGTSISGPALPASLVHVLGAADLPLAGLSISIADALGTATCAAASTTTPRAE